MRVRDLGKGAPCLISVLLILFTQVGHVPLPQLLLPEGSPRAPTLVREAPGDGRFAPLPVRPLLQPVPGLRLAAFPRRGTKACAADPRLSLALKDEST